MEKKPEAKPGSLDSVYDASVTWRYIAPVGHTLDMCQRPDYFRNVARECGQQRVAGRHSWNRIEILSEDGSWEAELRVLSAADGLVHTRLLRDWTAPSKPGRKPNKPEGYAVEMVPANGWRVLDPNAEIVATRLATEDEANRAAADHARRVKGD